MAQRTYSSILPDMKWLALARAATLRAAALRVTRHVTLLRVCWVLAQGLAGLLAATAALPFASLPFGAALMGAYALYERFPIWPLLGMAVGSLMQMGVSWQLYALLGAVALVVLTPLVAKRFAMPPVLRQALVTGGAVALPAFFFIHIPAQAIQYVLMGVSAGVMVPVYAVVLQGMRDKRQVFTVDDRICWMLGTATLVLGGMAFSVGPVAVGEILGALFVLLAASVGGAPMAIPVSIMLAFVQSLCGVTPYAMVAYSIGAAVCGMAHEMSRWTMAGLFLAADLTVRLLFHEVSPTLVTALAQVCGCLVFCLLPDQALRYVQHIEQEDGWLRPEATLLAKTQQNVASALLYDSAHAIADMADALPATPEATLSQAALLEELAVQLCGQCTQRAACWEGESTDMLHMLGEMMQSMQQGRAQATDVMQTARLRGCHRAVMVADRIQAVLRAGQRHEAAISRQELACRIATQQMQGHAQALLDMSRRVGDMLRGNEAARVCVARALSASRFRNCDVTAYTEQGRLQVLVRCETWLPDDCETLTHLIEQAVRCPMRCLGTQGQPSQMLHFTQRAALSLLTGAVSLPVEGETISGDSWLYTVLPDGNYLLALSDGMGNGERAYRASTALIQMLAHSLKAGYPLETALHSINGWMLMCQGEETYGTMDLCIMDAQTGQADFVKLGACPTYLLRGGACKRLECEALPLGIVEHVKPKQLSVALQAGDLFLLCSDGVVDAFGDEGRIPLAMLANLPQDDPQQLAETLMRRALHASGGKARDDMLVLATLVQADDVGCVALPA